MSWHLAPALDQLRAEVNALWPNRSKASDGTIGDAAHSARTSDHNPNARRSVNAIDITASGIDTGKLINAAKAHPSVRYIIHRGRIMNRDIGNFQSRHYGGSNPHNTHVHISIYQSATAERRTQSWGLANAKGGGTSGGGNRYGNPKAKHELGSRTLNLYSAGTDVADLQQRLKKLKRYTGGTVDGHYGPAVKSAVERFQRSRGLTADGIAGPKTIKALTSGAKKVADDLPKKPAKSKGKVPGPGYGFPLPKGHYFGPKSGPNRSWSGFHNRSVKGKTDRQWLREFATQLGRRGWSVGKGKTWLKRAGNDGKYGSEYAALIKAFQKDQGLAQDSLLGKKAWDAAFQNPIT